MGKGPGEGRVARSGARGAREGGKEGGEGAMWGTRVWGGVRGAQGRVQG